MSILNVGKISTTGSTNIYGCLLQLIIHMKKLTDGFYDLIKLLPDNLILASIIDIYTQFNHKNEYLSIDSFIHAINCDSNSNYFVDDFYNIFTSIIPSIDKSYIIDSFLLTSKNCFATLERNKKKEQSCIFELFIEDGEFLSNSISNQYKLSDEKTINYLFFSPVQKDAKIKLESSCILPNTTYQSDVNKVYFLFSIIISMKSEPQKYVLFLADENNWVKYKDEEIIKINDLKNIQQIINQNDVQIELFGFTNDVENVEKINFLDFTHKSMIKILSPITEEEFDELKTTKATQFNNSNRGSSLSARPARNPLKVSSSDSITKNDKTEIIKSPSIETIKKTEKNKATDKKESISENERNKENKIDGIENNKIEIGDKQNKSSKKPNTLSSTVLSISNKTDISSRGKNTHKEPNYVIGQLELVDDDRIENSSNDSNKLKQDINSKKSVKSVIQKKSNDRQTNKYSLNILIFDIKKMDLVKNKEITNINFEKRQEEIQKCKKKFSYFYNFQFHTGDILKCSSCDYFDNTELNVTMIIISRKFVDFFKKYISELSHQIELNFVEMESNHICLVSKFHQDQTMSYIKEFAEKYLPGNPSEILFKDKNKDKYHHIVEKHSEYSIRQFVKLVNMSKLYFRVKPSDQEISTTSSNENGNKRIISVFRYLRSKYKGKSTTLIPIKKSKEKYTVESILQVVVQNPEKRFLIYSINEKFQVNWYDKETLIQDLPDTIYVQLRPSKHDFQLIGIFFDLEPTNEYFAVEYRDSDTIKNIIEKIQRYLNIAETPELFYYLHNSYRRLKNLRRSNGQELIIANYQVGISQKMSNILHSTQAEAK